MTKILWHSNAPWVPTGYGAQTGLFAPQLAKHYDLALSSFFGLEGHPITWEGIPVLPGMGGEFGNETLPQHAARWFNGDQRGGLVVTLMDVWVLNAVMASTLNMACWVPVDHEPAPPAVYEFFAKSSAVPIAMSRFGERMLARYDPLYVPHGVDTTVFKPYPRKETREEVGLPEDAFLVGMVAANKGRPSRKGFSQAFQAFKKLRDEHDNAYLYLHTSISPHFGGGEDIKSMTVAMGIPDEAVLTTDQYRMMFNPHPPEAMARIYSTLDVLLNPAMGEGFGIPVIEAQACGTPVIVSDCTAMAEIGKAGWKVRVEPYWTGQNSWQGMPIVGDIAKALEQCYTMTDERRANLRAQARVHALAYDLERVMDEFMLPALRAAEQRFASQEPVTIPSRLKVAA